MTAESMVMRTAGAWLALMVLLAIPRGAYAQTAPVDTWLQQSQGDADRKSSGCVTCHTSTDSASMHESGTVRLGCIDCHGGNNDVRISQGIAPKSGEYERLKRQAHPQPRVLMGDAANPMRSYTDWLREDWIYVRFVNPGDLRVAEKTCGTSGCHTAEVRKVQTSMMTHGAMLWGAALYNNAAFPF